MTYKAVTRPIPPPALWTVFDSWNSPMASRRKVIQLRGKERRRSISEVFSTAVERTKADKGTDVQEEEDAEEADRRLERSEPHEEGEDEPRDELQGEKRACR
jgi:hypothetical protein